MKLERNLRMSTSRDGKHQFFTIGELEAYIRKAREWGATRDSPIWVTRTFKEPTTVHLNTQL